MNQYAQGYGDKFGPEKMAVGWPWRLFLVSLLVFILALIAYFGLLFGYQPVLKKQIENLDREIAVLSQEIPAAEQEDFIAFYSQVANLEKVLKSHAGAGKVFPFLERFTDKGVYYQRADLSLPERRLKIDGLAPSYEVLASQLLAFEEAPEVERAFLESSSLSDGQVKFTAAVIFKKEIFRVL